MTLQLLLMSRQRYADDPPATIKHALQGPLDSCQWSYSRKGGCNNLSATFVFPETTSFDELRFASPAVTDWQNAEWHGGEVVVSVKYQGLPLQQLVLRPLFRGRITRLAYEPASRRISVEAEGLVRQLDELHLTRIWTTTTIRQILTDIGAAVVKTGRSQGGDSYIRAISIVGPQSALDLPISLEVKWETARSVIERVFEYLSDGMTWGVDGDGTLYVDQQVDPYQPDLSGLQIPSIHVRDSGVRWQRTMQFDQIRTIVTVLGEEDVAKGTRISASVECQQARKAYGPRQEFYSEPEITDVGLAAKLAAARVKRGAARVINGRLTTTRLAQGQDDVWQAITPLRPLVGLLDIEGTTDIVGRSELGKVTEYSLRRYGDFAAYSCKDKGSAGAGVTIPSSTAERALNKGWLVHLAIRTDFSNPAVGAGTACFLAGRPDGSGGTDHGWGNVFWYNVDGAAGRLHWTYTTSGGTLRIIDTTISVPVAGGTTVHLTVWRDSSGVFRFYNGNTLALTNSSLTADTLKNTASPWRFFNTGRNDLGTYNTKGDFSFDEFWVLETGTGGLETVVSITGQPVQDFIGRNHNQALHVNEGLGVRTYCRFHLPTTSVGGTPTFPVYRQDTGPVGSLQTATYTRSLAGGTQNGAVITTGNRIGHFIGTEKKWGGPLLLMAEEVRYRVLLAEGILEREMDLGSPLQDGWATIGRMRDEIDAAKQVLRRTVTL